MIIDSDSIVNVIVNIVCNTMNADNTIICVTYSRITISVIMYAHTVMSINMNNIIIIISIIIIIIDNVVVTSNNTINYNIIGTSIINDTISIDTINDKLTSAHGVVINLIISVNVLLLLSDMNNDIIDMCIITNIIIVIVSNRMHISETDCKCYHNVSYDKIL